MICCHVYFIQEGESGPIKIGYAHTDVKSRMKSMQTSNSSELHLLATIPAKIYDERAWHHRFRNDRLRGEWFTPSRDLLVAIKEAVAKKVIASQLAAYSGDPFIGVHKWMDSRSLSYELLAEMIGYSLGMVRASLRSKQGFGLGFAQAIESVTDGYIRAADMMRTQADLRQVNRNRARARKAVPADSWKATA